jgi:hypothetical protein
MSSHNPPLSPSISPTYPLPCTYPEEAQEQPLSPIPLHIGLGPAPVLVPIRPSISPLGGVRRTQSDTRGPPLGDPSLEYMDPQSDFIRLRSAHKRSASSRCVVTLGPKKVAEREGIGEEEPDVAEIVVKHGKNCLLTNGVLPLIQTDRLALESIGKLLLTFIHDKSLWIVPTYIKSKSINPYVQLWWSCAKLTYSGGAKPAPGYTLQLTNPLNSTGTSSPLSVTVLTNRYLRNFRTIRDQTPQLPLPLLRRHNQRFNLRIRFRVRFRRPLISVFNCD